MWIAEPMLCLSSTHIISRTCLVELTGTLPLEEQAPQYRLQQNSNMVPLMIWVCFRYLCLFVSLFLCICIHFSLIRENNKFICSMKSKKSVQGDCCVVYYCHLFVQTLCV